MEKNPPVQEYNGDICAYLERTYKIDFGQSKHGHDNKQKWQKMLADAEALRPKTNGHIWQKTEFTDDHPDIEKCRTKFRNRVGSKKARTIAKIEPCMINQGLHPVDKKFGFYNEGTGDRVAFETAWDKWRGVKVKPVLGHFNEFMIGKNWRKIEYYKGPPGFTREKILTDKMIEVFDKEAAQYKCTDILAEKVAEKVAEDILEASNGSTSIEKKGSIKKKRKVEASELKSKAWMVQQPMASMFQQPLMDSQKQPMAPQKQPMVQQPMTPQKQRMVQQPMTPPPPPPAPVPMALVLLERTPIENYIDTLSLIIPDGVIPDHILVDLQYIVNKYNKFITSQHIMEELKKMYNLHPNKKHTRRLQRFVDSAIIARDHYITQLKKLKVKTDSIIALLEECVELSVSEMYAKDELEGTSPGDFMTLKKSGDAIMELTFNYIQTYIEPGKVMERPKINILYSDHFYHIMEFVHNKITLDKLESRYNYASNEKLWESIQRYAVVLREEKDKYVLRLRSLGISEKDIAYFLDMCLFIIAKNEDYVVVIQVRNPRVNYLTEEYLRCYDGTLEKYVGLN